MRSVSRLNSRLSVYFRSARLPFCTDEPSPSTSLLISDRRTSRISTRNVTRRSEKTPLLNSPTRPTSLRGRRRPRRLTLKSSAWSSDENGLRLRRRLGKRTGMLRSPTRNNRRILCSSLCLRIHLFVFASSLHRIASASELRESRIENYWFVLSRSVSFVDAIWRAVETSCGGGAEDVQPARSARKARKKRERKERVECPRGICSL